MNMEIRPVQLCIVEVSAEEWVLLCFHVIHEDYFRNNTPDSFPKFFHGWEILVAKSGGVVFKRILDPTISNCTAQQLTSAFEDMLQSCMKLEGR